jgi:Calcineurin-like phosphoesterase/Putative transposase
MTPVQFLARLAALVPPPRHPLVRFYGGWAPEQGQRSYLPSNDFAELVAVASFWQLWTKTTNQIYPNGRCIPCCTAALTTSNHCQASPCQSALEGVFSWLHISDLHMGAGGVSHRLDCRSVTNALLRDVRDLDRRCDALFFTGDLAFSARRQQFEELQLWIHQLREPLALQVEQVHVVPGNHDVRRNANSAVGALHNTIRERADLDAYSSDSTARQLLRRKFRDYLTFRSALYGRGAARSRELDWALQLPRSGRRGTIFVVGLNSCWVSDESDGGTSRAEGLVPNMLLSVRRSIAGWRASATRTWPSCSVIIRRAGCTTAAEACSSSIRPVQRAFICRGMSRELGGAALSLRPGR